MAVGNAVVLCDFAGAGPMVTTDNFDRLRRTNFGRGVLVNQLQPEHIQAEMERYDPSEAERVCPRVRQNAGIEDATHRWIELYEDVLQEFREMPRDVNEELQALAEYLRQWNYEKRVEWEKEQLNKLRGIPVFGSDFLRLARRMLSWWTK